MRGHAKEVEETVGELQRNSRTNMFDLSAFSPKAFFFKYCYFHAG